MELKPHEKRVIDEKTELDDKIVKLDVFVNSESFADLCDYSECCRLINQLYIMNRYSDILSDRIAAFTDGRA